HAQALAMVQQLYPKEQYPQGHPHLAISLGNLGALLQAMGQYEEARSYKEQALAMKQQLYPKDKYPQGHPELATSLNNLGANRHRIVDLFPTTHRGPFRFPIRRRIVAIGRGPSPPVVALSLNPFAASGKTSSAGSRQGPPCGGHHEG